MAHDDSKNMVTPLTQHTAWMDGIAEQVAKCVPASPDAGRIAELEKRVAALEEAVRPEALEKVVFKGMEKMFGLMAGESEESDSQ